MRVDVNWEGNYHFEAHPPSGISIHFDTDPDHGGGIAGPQPLETMLASLAACSAMDVIGILQKKRQVVTNYRVIIEGDRPPPGEWPRPITKIRIRHIVTGENIDNDAVARAVELSDTKYCSVSATLRQSPDIESTWEVN
jgi:putative redox protein